ncbi:MAG: InlB B-repeat-containing protein, partial [Clostridia bacterium]|nr:InlB B-repeat-containing protein [Clostridia bacterium]
MKTIGKKLLSWVLTLTMLFTAMPTGVFAEEPDTDLGETSRTYVDSQAGEDTTLPDDAGGDGESASRIDYSSPVQPFGDILRDSRDEYWTVRFYDRDADLYKTVAVIRGEAIGDEFPQAIAREDYYAYWAIGEIVYGNQGSEISVTGSRIDSSFVPESDTVVVPDYDKIAYTVTFYDEDKTTELAVKSVTVDTNYCVNDIPDVPAKNGSTSKWVYDGGDFDNIVAIHGNTSVWAQYDKNVFTVTYTVEGETYGTDTYYRGDGLVLPAEPVIEGKEFVGWYAGETEYAGGEAVNSDLHLVAVFTEQYFVSFVVVNDDGTQSECLSEYYRTADETIGILPQDPFVAGKVFEKWVTYIDGVEVEVTADTVVTGDMTIIAVFRSVEIYTIMVHYFYKKNIGADSGQPHVWNTEIYEVDTALLPYTVNVPASTQTDPEFVAGSPVYYATQTAHVVTRDDFVYDEEAGTWVSEFSVEFVEHTATYDFVYLLKDLTGDSYTEIEREANIQGVLNTTVTPTVKTYSYAVLEKADPVYIEQAMGQELPVYYTRKNFQLTYETNGGSYVAGSTVPYGTVVSLPAQNPTRTGYTFNGWYSDQALTQRVTGSVAVNQDTTLYAKWTGNTVNYTIIYMKEVYDNATGTTSYVYENSGTSTATVGTTVYAASAPNISGTLNGYARDAAMNGTATSAGAGEATAVKINADGSATLKVYYSLIRYTLVFNANSGTIRIGGQTYSGSNYRVENVVLGEAIGSRWPSSSNEIYRNGRYFSGWSGGPSTYITKQYELVWNHVRNANNNHVMTFTASWSNSSSDRDAYYWLQQTDGTWEIADEYTQIGLNTSNLGPKEIAGYSKHSPGDGQTAPSSAYPSSGNT